MDLQTITFGDLLGLGVSIFLIIKQIHPAYSLILGALIGGIVGGAGVLIQTGAAAKMQIKLSNY